MSLAPPVAGGNKKIAKQGPTFTAPRVMPFSINKINKNLNSTPFIFKLQISPLIYIFLIIFLNY